MVSRLELKIPPVAVLVIFAAAMWWTSKLVPGLAIALPLNLSLSLAFIIAGTGLLLGLLGIQAFRKANTTFDPTRPSNCSALVTTGVYRYSRNPMYVGLLTLLIAWALLLSHALPWLLLPAFIAYMNRFQIGPEERALSAGFGEQYEAYRLRVRRWL